MFPFNLRALLQEAKSIENEYIQSITAQNYWALFIPAIVCIIIECMNLIRLFFYSSGLSTLNNCIYFAFYLSLLLFTIAIMVLQELLKKNTTYLYYVHLTCITFYLIWNASLNIYQIHKGHQATLLVFITSFMGSLVIIHLRLQHSLVIIAGSSIFVVATSSHYLTSGQTSNLLISLVVGLLIVLTYFSQKVSALTYQRELAYVNQRLKEDKEQLRISDEKHTIIMNELHLFHFDWNVKEDYLIISSHCAKQFQCPAYIPNPKMWITQQNIIFAEDYPKLLAVVRNHVVMHAPNIIELRLKESEGVYHWYRLRLDALLNDKGELISTVGSLQNIEEFRNKNTQINQRILDQMEGTEGYFRHLKATQEKVLLYHHDMRHTLKLIDQLLAQGDLDAIKSHTQLAQKELAAIAPKLYCEHNIVNLILGSFEQLATTEHVTFDCHVSLPKTLPFTSLTLCTLFFNLLENSLFAAADVKDDALRKVEIHSYINNHKLVVKVQNGFEGTVIFEDGLPCPQVSKSGHGLGIKSIVDTVDTCDGMYLFKTEGPLFIAQILLPLDD